MKEKSKGKEERKRKIAENINFFCSGSQVQFSTHTTVPAHFKEQIKGRNK